MLLWHAAVFAIYGSIAASYEECIGSRILFCTVVLKENLEASGTLRQVKARLQEELFKDLNDKVLHWIHTVNAMRRLALTIRHFSPL